MLQDIRQNIKGTTAKIVVGLIVVTFAFFGIESILVSGGGNEIAVVNDEDIYPQELQQSIDTQRRRLIAMMGENIDPAMLDEDRLKGPALQALISRKLLMQSAKNMNLSISENQLGVLVSGMSQFQIDGVFSPEVYKSVLSSAGYTPGSFKNSLRDDMLINQLQGGLAGTEFATPSELQLNARVISEQRDLRYFIVPLEKFAPESSISEEALEAYYRAHEANYQTQEVVDVDYIEVSLDDFREPVEESAVLAAYETAKEASSYQTQNRVSHILFEPAGNIELQERVAKAQEQLSAGVPFAEVAAQYSEDVGSAARGGDLGYSSGEAFPEEMEAVVATLEPGVVSAPVETEAGTHLITVTERKVGEQPSLEQMRAELEDSIQSSAARVALLLAVESLKDLSFNAEDLSYPATELELPIQHIEGIARSQNKGLFSNESLSKAAFSEDVLEAGHNSEVIELPEDKFVVLRVTNHHLPELKPLADVKEDVLAAVQGEMARAAVTAEAERALTQLNDGVPVEQFAASQGYEPQLELGVERSNNTVPVEVLRRVFELPPPAGENPTIDFILMQNGDAVVIELLRVNEGEYTSLSDQEQQQLKQLLSAEAGSLIVSEFQQGLQKSATISVL